MKRTVTAVCALACAAFLCACAAVQEGKTDVEVTQGERAEGIADVPEETAAAADGQTDDTRQKVTSDGGQAVDVPDGEANKDGQDASSAVQMQGLLQGDCGSIGSGLLAYTLPGQDGEDYKLCFFKAGGKVSDSGMSMSEAEYHPVETADYIFPDVRENNAPIGKFIEIYFSDIVTIGGDGAAGLAVVAVYDVNGGTRYDTRIYRWDGTGYSADGTLMQELNERYGSTQDYPVEELYRLSQDTDGQSMQNPIGEGQKAEGTEQDYYAELIAAARGCIIKNNGEAPEGYDFSSVIYMKREGDAGILGYLIEDLDGDGTKELIFGENASGDAGTDNSWDGIVYDIYTVSDGKLVHVLDGWERNRYYLCSNGMIANEGSGGAANSNYSYYTFDGLKLNLAEAVIFDGMKDTDNPWFYSKESEDDAENADPISEGQADEIRGKYVYIRPEFIPFIDG